MLDLLANDAVARIVGAKETRSAPPNYMKDDIPRPSFVMGGAPKDRRGRTLSSRRTAEEEAHPGNTGCQHVSSDSDISFDGEPNAQR